MTMHPSLVFVVTSVLMNFSLSETEMKWCSEYLLSGFSGVPNEAFTASSSFSEQDDFSPDNARLYFERPNLQSSSGWCTHHINEESYIQVDLETKATVDSVSIQGRGDYPQWVKLFHILYSMDNVTWTRLLSSNNVPQLFTGNTDMNSVVKQIISPHITAKYIRVNARTWQSRPCLRFDLGGCTFQPMEPSRFALASLQSLATLGPPINLQPPGSSVHHCGIACHRQTDCVSFRFDVLTQNCIGYTTIGEISFYTHEIHYYYNTAYRLGFKLSGDFNYKVFELKQSQVNASESCISLKSFLVKVRTLDRLTVLQAETQQNNLLKQDFRFYVSGQYTTQWQDSDGDVINSTLWSPSNPDPAQGHCVMLTQSGLSSVDCMLPLFFICGY